MSFVQDIAYGIVEEVEIIEDSALSWPRVFSCRSVLCLSGARITVDVYSARYTLTAVSRANSRVPCRGKQKHKLAKPLLATCEAAHAQAEYEANLQRQFVKPVVSAQGFQSCVVAVAVVLRG